MGIFDFLKKIAGTTDMASAQDQQNKASDDNNDVFPTDFEHLTKDGELPFGWVYRNREFTEKINNEYSHFLNTWIESRSKSPMIKYQALKSFVLYLEDVEKLCKSKGECFEFWFYEILTSRDYINKRKSELKHLIANIESLQNKE